MNKDPIFPRNRKEVFVDLMKHHKMDLIKINLLIAAFALLSIATIYIFILLIGQVPTLISSGYIEQVSQMTWIIPFYLLQLFISSQCVRF